MKNRGKKNQKSRENETGGKTYVVEKLVPDESSKALSLDTNIFTMLLISEFISSFFTNQKGLCTRDPFRFHLLLAASEVGFLGTTGELYQLSPSHFSLPCEATMEQHLFLFIFIFSLFSATSEASPDENRGHNVETSLRGLIPIRTHLSPDRESYMNSIPELIAIKGVTVLRSSHSYAATSASSGSSTLPLTIAS